MSKNAFFDSCEGTLIDISFAHDKQDFGELTDGNVSFAGRPYLVVLNKNLVGKVISDPYMSAEKLAIFDIIDEVVENAAYVGSGNPIGDRKQNIIRYDYFETPVNIAGQDYIVAIDVEVIPGSNKYRTHKVINKISLTAAGSVETGPEPAAQPVQLGFSDTSVAQATQDVNKEYAPGAANDTDSSAKSQDTAQALALQQRAFQIDRQISDLEYELKYATSSMDMIDIQDRIDGLRHAKTSKAEIDKFLKRRAEQEAAAAEQESAEVTRREQELSQKNAAEDFPLDTDQYKEMMTDISDGASYVKRNNETIKQRIHRREAMDQAYRDLLK